MFWNGVGAQVFTNPGILTINLLDGNDTLNIWGTATSPVDVNVNMGNGNDLTIFSPTAGRLTNILGSFSLRGEAGSDTVVAADFNSAGATTYTVTNARFDRPGWGGFFYAADIEALALKQGQFSDTVNVTGTFSNQPVTLENSGGTDTINVGQSSQGVQFVSADLYIEGTAGVNTININDTGNTTARSANIDWNGPSTFGRVNNLAPAHIIWEVANTTAVNITTGIAGDTILVYSNRVPINLNSAGGTDTVLIGDNIVGGAVYIEAPITVDNDPFYTNLTINNYQDTVNRNWTIDTSGSYGSIVGMAPVPIYWDNTDINAIFLQCGRGLDTGHVIRLSETLVITNANGDNIDQITFGAPSAGGMQSITPGRNGFNVIENDPDYTNLTFDDTGDSTPRFVTLDVVSGYNELTGLAPATFRYDDNDVKQVTIRTGSAADNVNVLRAGTNLGKTTITTAQGLDSVSLGNGNNGMQGIAGDVEITNPQRTSSLTLNNRQDTVARNVTQTRVGDVMQITGLIPGTLRYVTIDVSSVELDGGGANDTYTISATAYPRPFRLETGAGADTLTVGGAGFAAVVELIEPIILDASLNIQSDGWVDLAGSSSSQVLVTDALSLSGTGTLNIADKQAILNYTGASPAAAIRASIASAYNGGAWDGYGITGAAWATPGTAVGFAESSDMYSTFPSSWFGQTLDNTAILFRHTLAGDTNLDRTVNLVDFNPLASNFGQANRIFGQGDFNYDSISNLTDFNILASRFGSALGPGGTQTLSPFANASRPPEGVLDDLTV